MRPLSPGCTLDGNSNGLEFPIEQVSVNHTVELFKLSQQAGGFCYLFHDVVPFKLNLPEGAGWCIISLTPPPVAVVL